MTTTETARIEMEEAARQMMAAKVGSDEERASKAEYTRLQYAYHETAYRAFRAARLSPSSKNPPRPVSGA